MESPTHFDLQVAITEYLRKIDQNHLLNQEEWDELFDHFLEETNALTEEGLTEREAFAMSQLRFGDTSLIRNEFEEAKPFGHIRKTLINALMLFFSCFIIHTLILQLSLIPIFIGTYTEVSLFWLKSVDLALKLVFIGGTLIYLFQRLKAQRFFTSFELWAIPILGTLSTIGGGYSLIYTTSKYIDYDAPSELYVYFMNNRIAVFIALTLVLILTHTLALRKPFEYIRRNLINSLMLFFTCYVIAALTCTLSLIPIFIETYSEVPIVWLKYADLALKFAFLGGTLVYLFRRLKAQRVFTRFELWVIPILGIFSTLGMGYSLLNTVREYLGAASPYKLWMHVYINNKIALLIALIVLIVLTYILVFRARKQLVAQS